jgi:hypothetical protein
VSGSADVSALRFHLPDTPRFLPNPLSPSTHIGCVARRSGGRNTIKTEDFVRFVPFTRLHAGRPRFDSGQGKGRRCFCLRCHVQSGSGIHPAFHSVGIVAYLWVKRPEREDDHSPPSSTEVTNTWSYTYTPQYVFMVCYLVKCRDSCEVHRECGAMSV